MSIKSKFQLAILVLLLSAGGLLTSLLVLQKQFDRQHALNTYTQEAFSGFFDLSLLASEYIITPRERIVEQWEYVYGSLEAKLAKIRELSDEKGMDYLIQTSHSLEAINLSFNRLISIQTDSIRGATHETQILYINKQIGTQLEDSVGNAHKLLSMYYRDMRHSQTRVIGFVFAVLIALLVFLISLLVYIILRIFKPLEEIQEVMQRVGSGDLNVEIDVTGRDELAVLGRAFNGMIEDLKVVTVAKVELEHEVMLRNQSLKDLKLANEQLEQFAYIAAHDLQEPLRMVSSYTQLLAKRYEDKLDDNGQEFIRYAVDGAQRMKVLIQDLLTYSRATNLKEENTLIDASSILGQAVANCKTMIDRENAVILNEKLPMINVDKALMVQVFTQLLSNAIKFKGQNIPRIYITAKPEEDQWVFAFKDNGLGIEKQYFEKIFLMFQRLQSRKEAEGTGIGLALCKRIINQHNGDIWLESTPGEGSTFYFSIPLKEEV